jgi:RNA polymerase sigma factor (TIGR02999 family)
MSSPDLTQQLHRLNQGDEGVIGEILPLVYTHLKHLARNIRRERGASPTLNTSALVHEAYLKLVRQDHYENRLHFFRVAAKAMRQIVYTYAQQQQAQKRGGNEPAFSLEGLELALPTHRWDDLLSIEQGLAALQTQSPRLAEVVECRFYAGLSVEETAQALSLSTATVKRDWSLARAWLHRFLTDQ